MDERKTFWGAIKALPRNLSSMFTFGAIENQGENYQNDIKALENKRAQLLKMIEEKIQIQVSNNTGDSKCPVCGNSPCTCVKTVVDKEKAKKDALVKEEKEYFLNWHISSNCILTVT